MSYLQDQIADALDYGAYFYVGDQAGNAAVFLKRGHTEGEVAEVTGRNTNSIRLKLSYADGDYFRPIMGGAVTVTMHLSSYIQFLSQGWDEIDETEWMLELYSNYGKGDQKLLFWGYVDKDSFQQDWNTELPMAQITAITGLALLRNIPFEPLPLDDGGYLPETEDRPAEKGPLFGVYKTREVIAYLFHQAGNIRTWVDAVPLVWQSGSATYEIFADNICVAEYFGDTCFEVLEKLMKRTKTQVLMYNGELCIRMPGVFPKDYLSRYNHKGNFVENFSADRQIVNTDQHLNVLSGSFKFSETIKKVIIEEKYTVHDNLVYNGDFSKSGRAGRGQPAHMSRRGGWFLPDGDNGIDRFSVDQQGLFFGVDQSASGSPEKRVLTNIDRGTYRTGHTPSSFWLFEFEIRAVKPSTGFSPPFGWRNKIDIICGNRRQTVEFEWGDDTKTDTVRHRFSMSWTNRPHQVGFYIPQVATWYWHPDQVFQIYSIKLTPWRYWTRTRPILVIDERYADEENSTDYVINEKSLNVVTEEINHTTGMHYLWENTSPYNSIKRRDTEGTSSRLRDYLIERIRWFYNYPRIVIQGSVKPVEKTPVVDGMTFVQDLALGRTFTVSSFDVQMRENTYTSIELIEYSRFLLEPPDNNWILRNGDWDDDGIWIDEEVWVEG